jgi:Effector-associated domain 7
MSVLRMLVDKIAASFNLEEIQLLCLELRVDCDEVPGDTKSGIIGNLVLHLQRRGHLDELLIAAKQQRPNIDLPTLSEIESEITTSLSVNLLDGRMNAFLKAKLRLPKLIADLKEGLGSEKGEYIRELYLIHKDQMLTGKSQSFFYCFENYSNLRGQLQILENYGFVKDVTSTNIKRYRMTEEFVEFLTAPEN